MFFRGKLRLPFGATGGNGVIFALPVGKLSTIMEDEAGFHIIRVLERKPSGKVPFEEAQQKLGVKIIYVITETGDSITKELLLKTMPDSRERLFYISGPKSMIDSFKKTLSEMGVSRWNIKTDFFPGFA